MLETVKSLVGDASTRTLKKYEKVVKKINALESKFESFTDEELKQYTSTLKQRLQDGESIHSIREESFALVREASKRVLHMRHYDVQLIGGLALLDGNIAEMPTGEGKTLVASLPAFTRALEGKGVHVITVNEYLAKRDKNTMAKLHEFLGLTVGININGMEAPEKKLAYACDITYGTGTEFGFDYLRDNGARNIEDKVQRPFHYCIIDEVDSILIDEAKVPLIIAGKSDEKSELYHICKRLVARMKKEKHYEFDIQLNTVHFTDDGFKYIEQAFDLEDLFDLNHISLLHFMTNALRAHVLQERDVHYIVKDDEIQLVDMFTGRIMEGRSLSDGLHQAIEAKENVTLSEENMTVAFITVQNYFRMYPILSGMTGTAKTDERELIEVYNMRVIQIPTNRSILRKDLPDIVYKTIEAKYKAVTEEIKRRNATGQPVLVGTTSILQSEALAKYLDEAKITYQILNAKTEEQEIELIASAGQKDRVTVATNMAGRGTDIILGEGVASLGGLHVIGTERHESVRIDNQLKGRAGRQGDPGSSQFHISLEDPMILRFGAEELEKYLPKVEVDSNSIVRNKDVNEFVTKIQKVCEGQHSGIRSYNLKIDDILNEQRLVIYNLRDRFLRQEVEPEFFYESLEKTITSTIADFTPDTLLPEEWKIDQLQETLKPFLLAIELDTEKTYDDREDIASAIQPFIEETKERYTDMLQHEYYRPALFGAAVQAIDFYWTKHIEDMNHIKDGLGLHSYNQEDPILFFERTGFHLFMEKTYDRIQKYVAEQLALIALYEENKDDKEEIDEYDDDIMMEEIEEELE